jgi:4-amino-4-deoxy-L-arabinose transferase-like glycosyltransferase
LVLLILLLALALRLQQLGGDSLWGDEIFTATQSPLPPSELLNWTAGDIHPPGYYLIVGRLADWLGWAHLTPSALTDWLWRFPSVLTGTLAIAVTYRMGAELLGRRVGLAGALLLSVSPVAIQYSQEARMHELLLLGAVLSTWALGRALAKREQWGWWLAYALATALSLYTVYLAFLVIAAQAGWVLKYHVSNTSLQRSDLKSQISTAKYPLLPWLASVVFAFVLYLPWWPVLLSIVTERLAVGGAKAGVGPPLEFLEKGLRSLGPGPGWSAWLFFGLWMVGLGRAVARRRSALALYGGLWLILPLSLPLVFRDPRALHLRYVFLLPIYLLFVAQGGIALVVGAWKRMVGGGRRLEDRKRGLTATSVPNLAILQTLLTVLLLGLALISALYLPGYYQRTKPDWRGAGAYLTAHTIPGDLIITGPLFDVGRYLDYYYQGPAELMPPALLVAGLPQRVASLRASGGRVWAVTRFSPAPTAAVKHIQLPGLVISEPTVAIYEANVLQDAMVDLMQQATSAAPRWAAEMATGGVMNPDPLVARAAAYLFLGDVYREAGRLPEAIAAYKALVTDYPGSAGGYVTLAEAYEAAGRVEEAAKAYRRAVVLNSAWQGAAADEAALLADSGHWAEAVAAYRAIVR